MSFRAAYILLSFLTQSYTLQIDMTVSNLPNYRFHQTTPDGIPSKKLENLDRPTLLQQPYKTISTSHRRVFSQHPHRAPHGRIKLSSPPPSPYQSGHSESYLASLIDQDSLQPDIHTLYIF